MSDSLGLRWLDPRHSITSRLTLVMVLLVAATVATVTFITVRTVQDRLTGQTGESFEARAGDVNDVVRLFLVGRVSQLQALASGHLIRDTVAERNASYAGGTEEALQEIQALDERWIAAGDDDALIAAITDQEANPVTHEMTGFLDAFKEQSEVFVTDRYGATVGATGRLSDYYQADEEWWQAAWNDGEGAVYISDPEFDESAGITALLIAVPLVDDESGDVIGIARSTLDIGELSDLIRAVSFGRTGRALLLDPSGQLLFEPPASDEGSPAAVPSELTERSVQRTSGFEIAKGPDGKESIFGFARPAAASVGGDPGDAESQAAAAVAKLGWTAVVAQETDEAFASSSAIVQSSTAAGIVVAVVAGLVALLVARAVTRPIMKLADATEAMGAGNLDVPLSVSGSDEVGRLTASFGKTTARLADVIHSLEGRTAQLSRAKDQLEQRSEELRLVNEELRERNRQLLDARARAATDSLTGLSNHRTFHEDVRDEVQQAQVNDTPVSLIMLDVDGFKRVNDCMGHQAGDEILREIALVLSDTVGGEKGYRYGGDEFAVLLAGTDDRKAVRLAERLRRAVAARTACGDRKITISLGVASFPDTADSAEQLIYGADATMYWAKSVGKNRVGQWSKLIRGGADGVLPLYDPDRDVKAPDAIAILVAALTAKDRVTGAHTERCSWYAARLAVELGLEENETYILRLASLLHDVGKIAVPDEVLFKPGPLTEEEWAQMKQHPAAALHVVSHIRSITEATPAILHHHEHFDGSGYPDGLAGEEIPMASRILLVTDAFDAMTTDRPYRRAMPVEAAIEELQRNSGGQFDPAVVEAFLRILSREGPEPLRGAARERGARPLTQASRTGPATRGRG